MGVRVRHVHVRRARGGVHRTRRVHRASSRGGVVGGDAGGGEVARVGDRGVEGDGRERAVLFARDVGHGGEGRAGGGDVRREPGARRGGGAGFFANRGGRRSSIRSIFDGDGRARGVHAPGVQRRDVRGARGHGGNRARAAPQTPADANDE